MIMKNTLLFALAALSAAFSASASPLSPQEALQRVSDASARRVKGSMLYDSRLLYTFSDKENLPQLYVFTGSSGQGFLIVSADDMAVPLLGYSDQGSFDPSALPPQLLWWLDGYRNEVSLLRSSSVTSSSSSQAPVLPDMEAIEPLLKSKWNQGTPYNRYCYELEADGDSVQSVTGCVATAMAQVMYYFQAPAVGQGEISFKHPGSATYSMDFSARAFDWNAMRPTYYPGSYSEAEGDAVAYLMKACGYSVKMDYSKGDAGASGANIPEALIKFFGYKGGMRLETRKFWSYTDWAQMIHKNLLEVGPVIYDGDALDGGHSFVCDGYDGNGYFHFNWGWGGMADGYYLLDALNPDEYGIGGAAGGYNLGQQIVLGITPDNKDIFGTHIMQFGNATGKIDDSVLSLELADASRVGFQYIDPQEITVTFGLMVENVSDSSQPVQYFESDKTNLSVSQSDFFTWKEVGTSLDLEKVEMTEGDDYDFIMATRITTPAGSQWVATVPMIGYSNKVTVSKSADGYHLTEYSVANLEVSGFKVLSDPVYLDMPVQFEATFTNNTESEITRNYSGELFDAKGTKCYTMENFSVTLSPGVSQSVQWSSVDWYKAKDTDVPDITSPVDFTLRLYDNWQGRYVDVPDQTVTVHPTPSVPVVDATLSVDNATRENDVFVVDGNSVEVSITVNVEKGLFNKPILLELQAPMADGRYSAIQHERFDVIPNLSEGESATYSMSMLVPDAAEGVVYRLEASGSGLRLETPVLVKFKVGDNGVSLVPDQNGEFLVYDLNGVCVLKTSDSSQLRSLPPGLYIINGRKFLK